jgi:hypothetical protein
MTQPETLTTAQAAQKACPFSAFAVCRTSSCMAWRWTNEPAREGCCLLLARPAGGSPA